MTLPALVETHTSHGATLKLYRCPDCAGDCYAPEWSDSPWENCPTCDGIGVVEVCVGCGETFSVDTIDPENFDPGELYTDKAGRCWQCARDRGAEEAAAWPFTPEQLAEADERLQFYKDEGRHR